MHEVLSNFWHKGQYYEVIDPKLLKVRERGKVAQNAPAELEENLMKGNWVMQIPSFLASGSRPGLYFLRSG